MKGKQMLQVVGLMAVTALASRAQGTPEMRHTAVHLLRSDRLNVEVMDPTDPARYNRGMRFCPLASVLRVNMDGHDFLFSPIVHDPVTENCGIPSEFDIGEKDVTQPPGFAEAAPGQGFLKIGVGVLRKETKPTYDFFHAYAVIKPADCRATWNANSAHFEQDGPQVNGYGYRLEEDVSVAGNELRIDSALTNTGTKPFVTEQYAHNFFSFDDMPIGPGYLARFSFDFHVKGLKPEQRFNGREIDFFRPISKHDKAINAVVTPVPGSGSINGVTVMNTDTGLDVHATVTEPSQRIVVHITPRYLCPEQFILLDLKPGETKKWSRLYQFFDPTTKAVQSADR